MGLRQVSLLFTIALTEFSVSNGCMSRLFQCEEAVKLHKASHYFHSQHEWRMSLARRIQGAVKMIDFADPSESDYSFVIDAGSSHSEVILFTWSRKVNGTGFVREVASCETESGIDDFGVQFLDQTSGSLLKCIRDLMEKVPLSYTGPFPILLGATAGMRILELENPSVAHEILDHIRTAFEVADFSGRRLKVIQPPKILSGVEEGLYAWITANYLLKLIPSEALPEYRRTPKVGSIGILDMGGGSAQIAFQSQHEGNSNVEIFGKLFPVRSYSNLCFGTDEARLRHWHRLILQREYRAKSVFVDPCMADDVPITISGTEFTQNLCLKNLLGVDFGVDPNINYTFIGGGLSDSEKCRQMTYDLTNLYTCRKMYQFCPQVDGHSKRGRIFYAISSYYYTFRVLPSIIGGRDSFASERTLLNEINNWCDSSLSDRTKLAESFADNMCFRMYYSYHTIRNIFSFGKRNWPQIHFVRRLSDTSVGWALGFMLQQSNLLTEKESKQEVPPNLKSHLVRINEKAKEMSTRLWTEPNLLAEENQLSGLCESIANLLTAKVLFHFQKCGHWKGDRTDCCRGRFTEW